MSLLKENGKYVGKMSASDMLIDKYRLPPPPMNVRRHH
jgi:hypothetical protein